MGSLQEPKKKGCLGLHFPGLGSLGVRQGFCRILRLDSELRVRGLQRFGGQPLRLNFRGLGHRASGLEMKNHHSR